SGNLNSMLMVIKADRPKAFKPEVRKKLELPAQKNLVTKYFCSASLEAKREFKAPRITTNNSSPVDKPSPGPILNTTEEGAACESNISTLSNSPSGHTHADNDFIKAETEVAESPPSENTMDMIIRTGNSLLQNSACTMHKPCTSMRNELHRSPSFGTKSKMEKENGKVVVRSRFFQHKLGKENKEDSAQETLLDVNDAFTKRKTCSYDVALADNLNPKRVHMDNSLQSNENASLAHDMFSMEMKTNDKFGSNISHLDRYSSIAEQSMERYVSVISSFKYTGSGSRASGLRAPLREVKTTIKNRSNVGIDFSQFAYVPKDQKAGLASRKG
ncbi:hypothetical protein CRG98_038759, partial [Punica granatum]